MDATSGTLPFEQAIGVHPFFPGTEHIRTSFLHLVFDSLLFLLDCLEALEGGRSLVFLSG